MPSDSFLRVANMLKLSNRSLGFLLAKRNDLYKTFFLAKPDGSDRRIDAPVGLLKSVQRTILSEILEKIQPHPNRIGFLKGHNVLSGAKKHVGKKYLLNIDLKDFFHQITDNRVRGLFSRVYHIDITDASLLAMICTYNGVLSMGAPTSPYITNIICYTLDKRLANFCEKLNIGYSAYADDLTFSSDRPLTKKFIKTVTSIIEGKGFVINKKKVKLMTKSMRREVTGIVINEKLNVPRKKRKIIRAMFHNARNNPSEYVTKIHKLRGNLEWLKLVNLDERTEKKYKDVIEFLKRYAKENKIKVTSRKEHVEKRKEKKEDGLPFG